MSIYDYCCIHKTLSSLQDYENFHTHYLNDPNTQPLVLTSTPNIRKGHIFYLLDPNHENHIHNMFLHVATKAPENLVVDKGE